ncbi:MAG: hypothetical protein U5K38_07610 [Woeseiaceae bacterium]|nr:hypothetical protein [Woeseiaceae bacterium]
MVHDFTASYFFTNRIELYGGISNAFDEEPLIVRWMTQERVRGGGFLRA